MLANLTQLLALRHDITWLAEQVYHLAQSQRDEGREVADAPRKPVYRGVWVASHT